MPGKQNTIDLGIGADLTNLSRDLARMSGLTEKEASKAVKRLDRQIKRAEKASKQSARKAAKEWEDAFNQVPFGSVIQNAIANPLTAAATAAVAAGGALWKFSNDLSVAVDNANLMAAQTGLSVETIGQLEYALGGAGVQVDQFKGSLAAFNQVLHDSPDKIEALGVDLSDVRTTDEALTRTIRALGRIENAGDRSAAAMKIFGAEGAALATVMDGVAADLDRGADMAERWYGEDAQAASAAMDVAMRDLQTSIRAVSDTLAMEAIPHIAEFAELVDGIVGPVLQVRDAIGSVTKYVNVARYEWMALQRVMEAVAGTDDAFDAMVADGERAAQQTSDVVAAALAMDRRRRQREAEEREALAEQAAAEELKRQERAAQEWSRLRERELAEDERAAAAAAAAELRAAEDLARELANIRQQTAREGAADSVLFDLDEESRALEALKAELQAVEDIATVEARLLQLQEQRAARVQEISQAEALAAEQAAADMRKATEELARLDEMREQAAIEQWLTQLRGGINMVTGSLGLVSQVADVVGDVAEVIEANGEAQQKAALTAFRAQQAGAVAAIGISAAEAVMKAAAQYPPGTPLSGALAASIGLIGALSAAQIGAVLAQKPPTFHSGGIAPGSSLAPDEVYRATRNEGQVGVVTPQGLNALNRGESIGGEIVVVHQYQHRSFGAFVQDNAEIPNAPLRKAIRTAPRGRVGRRSRRK